MYIAQNPSRLDVFLVENLKQSRNQIAKLIKDGHVKINDKIILKPSFKLEPLDKIHVDFPCLKEDENEPYKVDFDINIIHEDEDILVLNKPPHLTVHQAPSVHEATLVDWLKIKGYRLSTLNGELRHGIVHRLDKQTSGAIVIAKNNKAHQNLSIQLQDKSMGRYYLALIDLRLKENCLVDRPIARNPKNRLKMDTLSHGRNAKTAFFELIHSQNTQNALLACKLFTGRTHQIRVHLKSISRHILGDDLYGFKSQKAKISRIMLHAYLLYLVHPTSGEKILFKAPMFEDFLKACENNFNIKENDEIFKHDNIISSFELAHKWLCYR